MKKPHDTHGYLLKNEVKIDLDVLRPLMLNRVGGHVDCADVVVVDKGSTVKRNVERMKKQSEPRSLSNTISDGAVLGLSAGAGHGVLTLGRPGDQVVTKEHSIARGGLARIGTASLVSIRINHQVILGQRSKMKTQM
jgi:hypothetical protein